MIITEETKKAFNLTEDDCEKIAKMTRQGKSLGESLVALGKATRKVVDVKADKKPKAQREIKIDPVKDWLLRFVAIPLEGCVGNKDMTYNVSCVLRDGTKKIDLTINGESYSLTLTKHKKKV